MSVTVRVELTLQISSVSCPVNTASPEESRHVMLRAPLPTAVQEKVTELPLSSTESMGGSVMIKGPPEIIE